MDEFHQNLEQTTAYLSDHFSLLWYGLYTKCYETGFTKEQSFELVKTYIIAQGTGDKIVRPGT